MFQRILSNHIIGLQGNLSLPIYDYVDTPMDRGDGAQWGFPWHGQLPGLNVLSQMAGKLTFANQGPIIPRTMFPMQLGAGVGSLVSSVALGARRQDPPINAAIRTRPLAWEKGLPEFISKLQPVQPAYSPSVMGGQPDSKFCRTFKLSEEKRTKERNKKRSQAKRKREHLALLGCEVEYY